MRSDMVAVLSRKLDRVIQANQILDAGAEALRKALLHYGDHTQGCVPRTGGTECNCDWDSTRAIVEKGK